MKPMQPATISQRGNDGIEIQGRLDFASVPALIKQAERYLREAKPSSGFCVDLSGVDSSNSAGVAFLLELNRLCLQSQLTLNIRHMPQPMQTIARAHGVDEALNALV
ncbi:MAG TPA: STAS domain-containing protein [Thiotrichales bacterium]|nr:STAS domain-containing protein [Thiotrichales bacterium]